MANIWVPLKFVWATILQYMHMIREHKRQVKFDLGLYHFVHYDVMSLDLPKIKNVAFRALTLVSLGKMFRD